MTTSSENTPAAPQRRNGRLKNMALFLVSPFIAMYYAVLMPGKLIQLAMADFKAASTKPTDQS